MRSTRGRGTRELARFFRLAEATRRQQWHKAGPRGASWAEPTADWLSPVDGLRPSRFVYWLSYGSSCLLPHGQVRESYTNKSNVAEVFLVVIHRKSRFQLLFASPVSCLNLASKSHLARLLSSLSMGSSRDARCLSNTTAAAFAPLGIEIHDEFAARVERGPQRPRGKAQKPSQAIARARSMAHMNWQVVGIRLPRRSAASCAARRLPALRHLDVAWTADLS